MSKFYMFYQNNSGGFFDEDDKAGIGKVVTIEAENEEDANDRAKQIGLYFDGCDKEIDCPCCGDRWYMADDMDIVEMDSVSFGFIHYKNGKIEYREY